MNKLLLHPTTEYQLSALIQSKPQALLICGSKGVGKQTIADVLVSSVLGDKFVNNPYFLVVKPEKTSIGIEEIRQIRDFMSRKTTGTKDIRRVVLIPDAHTMTNEAQNALLKTLEEPPADTMVILTVDDFTALKYTIRSRSQQLRVLPVQESDALEYFAGASHLEAKVKTAYYMSDGRVGLLASLLEQAQDHELVSAITKAKEIIGMSSYERLLGVESLSKQKDEALLLLEGMERVVLSGLRQAARKEHEPSVRKFYDLSKYVAEAQNALGKSANVKLVMTDLFLKFS